MKKYILSLAIILLLVIACTYILIPATIRVSRSVSINAPKDGLYRKLVTGSTWSEWWPEKQNPTDTSRVYTLEGIRFYPGAPTVMFLPVLLKASNFSGSLAIRFLPKGKDSTTLQFDVTIPATYNPFKRIAAYFNSKKLANQCSTLLTSINNFYSNTGKLYNYDIQIKLVVDSTLIFTSAEIKGIPDNNSIYLLIDKLKNYISKNNAKETGAPMLNILTMDSINYLVKVAIPVDKKLPSSGDISYRWMLGGGKILITEVKGGQPVITNAYQQILNYISDYHLVAPAIPFESLVTDRRKEPDSSKWVTRIYYPVM